MGGEPLRCASLALCILGVLIFVLLRVIFPLLLNSPCVNPRVLVPFPFCNSLSRPSGVGDGE